MGRKPNNPFAQDFVTFRAGDHSYTDKNGEKYISVSQLLSLYSPKFDPENHILRACAKRDGVTPEELQKKWLQKSTTACQLGTEIHSEIEHFVNTGKIRKSEYKDIATDFKTNIFPMFEHQIFSEVLVYSETYKIAGLSDLVEYDKDKNEISISDIKSNQTLEKKVYNNFLYPLDKMKNSVLNKYFLQLSFYARLLELRGFKVKENFKIFWVNQESRKIETIPVPYLKKEVENLIQHYTEPAF